MHNKKRFHFGVILSTMDNANQYDIWSGIVEYARKNDIHLTAYCGTYQMTVNDFASHFETCFETIRNSGSLDGVIMFSGFIAHIIGNENFEKYAARIPARLPLVSVSYVMPGVPSVIIDNITGMYAAVEHLIQVHGKKQIAFVKGPNGHPEAEDRLEGYKRALAANGISYDDRYVFPGHFDHASGRNAVKKLFETPGLSADAIAASNDVSAIGVLSELKNYNFFAPADFAVTGFDDDKVSAAFIPSISTARQDFRKFGLISAEMLLNQIMGKPVEKITYVPPVFVTRQSCGCLEKEFVNTGPGYEYGQIKSGFLISYVLHNFTALFQKDVPAPQIKKWASSLVDMIKESPFSKEKFLCLLNEILIGYNNYAKDFFIWNEALDILSMGTELYGDEIAGVNTVRSTLTYAATFVHNIRFRERESREIALSDNRWMARRIAGNLVLIFDIDSLAEDLYRSLPVISIDTVIIGLYHNPIKNGSPDADRTIDTLIGFDGDRKFNIKNTSSNPILFSDYSSIEKFDFESKRRDLLFIPLFFKDEEFGIMLMPFNPDISVDTYEMLRVNISAAVKGAELIKEIKYQNDLLQSTLEKANEASKAKSNFLSSMSHEMRTPMNAIIGMTAIGKKARDLDEKDYALNKIGDASTHLLGVINDVLDMSKIEANKLELAPVEFHFDRMLQKVVAVVNFRVEEKRQSLFVNVDERIPRFVVGDEQRLAQVVTNLMSNAVKFTPEGGSIYLEASLVGETDEECELRISVADSGIGISPEQQGRLFQPFEQAENGTNRKYGGTGLGLVISKNIVELMGGRIWIESELGRGAKFILTIKVLRGEKNTNSPIAHNVNRENVKILIADDMPEIREQFQNIFSQLDIKCDVASDGIEACRIIEERGGYDIYFIDWIMPRMDGIELARQIKSRGNEPAVVIMITAMDWEQIKDEAVRAGVDKHLLKPLFPSTIIDCLNECLGKAHVQAEVEDAEYVKGEFAGKRLLLAEDVEINREILTALLEDTGISIDCAENGQMALEMLESSVGKYDIVFMDVQMPKMDGYEATRAIRALPAMQGVRLPIIAMTANVFQSDIEESFAAGMNEHLRKPIDLDRVLKVLRKYL